MNEVSPFFAFLFAAGLVEAVTGIIMDLLPASWHQVGGVPVARYVAFALGLALAYDLGLSVYDLVGLQASSPALGIIAAGLLIGRGSNFVHDFLEWVRGLKAKGDSVG